MHCNSGPRNRYNQEPHLAQDTTWESDSGIQDEGNVSLDEGYGVSHHVY